MRTVILILAVLLMVASLSFAQGKYVFNFDFNKDQEGAPPSGGWKPTAEGKVEVVSVPSATNKSVKITDVGNGAGMTLLLSSPIKGKTYSLEFRFMREKGWTVACEIFYIMNQKCPDDWSGICIKDNDDGTFAYHDGNTWINSLALEDGVWHDFKVVMYPDIDKYDLYYDGKEIIKGTGYRKFTGLEGQGLDKFNVANVGDGGSTFVKYFDDIVLYEGTVRPTLTPVKSEQKLSTKWGEIKADMSEKAYREYPAGHRGTRFEKGLIPMAYSNFNRLSR